MKYKKLNNEEMYLMTRIAKQRLTLFIHPAIAKQAKAQAVVEEINLTDLVEKALINYLPTVTVIKKVEMKTIKK